MKILTVSVAGIGPFAEPVTLDLRDVPSGLIAVCGANGQGKTFLLESMVAAWFRRFPSRGEILDYATTKTAYIDVTAVLEGRGTYRARLQLDGVKRVSDAILERDGRLLNDGKVSTFDEAVARELPPLPLVLASAFAAQNKAGSFLRLDKGKRKELFAQLLGLDHYEALAATARTCALTVDRRVAELQSLVGHLRPQTTDEEADELGALGNRYQVELSETEERVRSTKAAQQRAADQIGPCQQRVEAHATDARELVRVKSVMLEKVAARERTLTDQRAAEAARVRDLNALATRVYQRKLEYEDAVRAVPPVPQIEQTWATAVAEIHQRSQTRIAAAETRIANNRALLDRRDEIERHVAALDLLERRRAEVADAIDQCEQARRLIERERSVAQGRLVEHLHWPDELARAKEAVTLLDRTPFGERCAEAHCEFVQNAVVARDAIPGCEAGVEALQQAQEAFDSLTARVEEVRQRAEEYRGEARAIDDAIKTEHAATREDAARLQVATARVKELEQDIETARADERQALDQADTLKAEALASNARELARTIALTKQAEADALTEQGVIEEAAAKRLADLVAEHDRISTEIRQLHEQAQTLETSADQHAEAERDLAAAAAALEQARQSHTQAVADQARLDAEIRAFEQRRGEFRQRQATRERLEAAVTQLQTDLVEWQALDRVFGKQGLPVLEIDAAGPGVSALANDLLQVCFDGRFQIELITQEPKADKKGFKDAFEVRVFDAERGGAMRDLLDLSGGEQVIVDEALKSAIAIFVNQRNEAPIRTVFRDETAGALDPDNSVRYVAMLRRVLERSGAYHVLFVSQSPDISALADAQIRVADGHVSVVYPPY